MDKLAYYIWHPLVWLISWLPLSVLYRVSDFMYYPVSLAGYRRKVILNNLKMAFPEKDEKWRKEILYKFYRHFCDLFVEVIKMQHISDKEIHRRVTFSNVEVINNATGQGKDVVAVLGHYGNWEWVPAINLHTNSGGFSVYRPLKDKWFDRYMLKLRSRFGSDNVTMKQTLRTVANLRKQNTRFMVGLIADQSPGKYALQYWTTFLSQPTPVLLGPEKIARMVKGLVIFFKVTKPRRGHYHVEVVPYDGNIPGTDDHEITEWHVGQLEKSIKERPELWLWSHRRWKYQDKYKTNLAE